jgi:hypothetical protein
MATTIGVTIRKFTVAAETSFTVTRLREFVTSTLSDAVLQTYLAAAMDAIDKYLGPLNVVERIEPVSGEILPLSREAESIISVVEMARGTGTTLAVNDYELSEDGTTLYRLDTGTNPEWRWRGHVKVTYTRKDDVDARIRVAVALVQLELNHVPGLTGQQIGSWSEQYTSNSVMNYQIERDGILATLLSNHAGVF